MPEIFGGRLTGLFTRHCEERQRRGNPSCFDAPESKQDGSPRFARDDASRRLHLAAALGVLAWALLVTLKATCNEDAFITFRVLDNFVQGYGLRWNVHERVQVYTNPLWLFINIPPYLLHPNIFHTGIAMGVLCSALAAWLLLSQCASVRVIAAVTLILLVCRSVTEYGTSGLENSLTNLLLAAFTVVLLRRKDVRYPTFLATLLAALAMLNRLDMAILFGVPLVMLLAFRRLPFSVWQIVLGGLPLVLWLAFATFYYGSPLPNTYFAKLAPNFPVPNAPWLAGISYLRAYFRYDLAGALLLLAALPMALAQLVNRPNRSVPALAMLCGALCQVAYVVSIGGDYMSGRFLTAPTFAVICALVIILRRGTGARFEIPSLVALACAAFLADKPPADCWLQRQKCQNVTFDVFDHWKWSIPEAYGLFDREWKIRDYPKTIFYQIGMALRDNQPNDISYRFNIGQMGYYGGPTPILIDECGLTDPLMARITRSYPRLPGHRVRLQPRGYIEALQTGDSSRMSPNLAAYYEALKLITQGPLFDRERLLTLLDFQLGRYDVLMQQYVAEPNP